MQLKTWLMVKEQKELLAHGCAACVHSVCASWAPPIPIAHNGKADPITFKTHKRGFKINQKEGPVFFEMLQIHKRITASWQPGAHTACQNKLSCALAQGFGKLCNVYWKYISREPWQHQAVSHLIRIQAGVNTGRGDEEQMSTKGSPWSVRGLGLPCNMWEEKKQNLDGN